MIRVYGFRYRIVLCLGLALAVTSIDQKLVWAQSAAGTLAADCAGDIKQYCSAVTPGESRVVACLIAFEDRISPRCRLTAYLASGDLGNRLKSLQKMARICSSDITQYCSKVVSGGGRIYDCIKKNKATLTDECRKGLETLAPL
jgi:hypothetical protein